MTESIEITVSHGGELHINGFGMGVHFTKQEADFLRLVLTTTHVLTKDFALAALYPREADEPEPKIFDVIASRIRKKLGVIRAYETVWGRGWARVKNVRWVEYEADQVLMPCDMVLLSELCQTLERPPEIVVADLVRQAHKQIVLGEA